MSIITFCRVLMRGLLKPGKGAIGSPGFPLFRLVLAPFCQPCERFFIPAIVNHDIDAILNEGGNLVQQIYGAQVVARAIDPASDEVEIPAEEST